jgi:exodeoxyribonuclease X
MKIEEALFRVLDCETTGLDVETARIVEIGACDVFKPGRSLGATRFLQSTAASWLCDPGIPIPPEAKAVHHILDSDVRGQPPALARMTPLLPAVPLEQTAVVYVAHNAKYDRPILEAHGFPAGARWLCTWRLAMHVWPEAPSYKNEVLRYWLGYDDLPLEPRPLAIDNMPHRAAHDAAVTALILREAFQVLQLAGHANPATPNDVDALIAWAESPVVLKGLCGFGKHFDKTWSEVARIDAGYLDWMIKQEDREPGSWDIDKIHTARHYRGRLV